MTDNKVTLKRYRTYNYYPYKVLEVEAETNGEIIYMNTDVRNGKKLVLDKVYNSDSVWWYKEPLTEIDDFENSFIDLSIEEIDAVFEKMIQLWNENPVFNNSEEWKEVWKWLILRLETLKKNFTHISMTLCQIFKQ